MHIIDHTRRDSARKRRRNSNQKFRLFIIISCLIFLIYILLMAFRFTMPVTPIKPVVKNLNKVSEPAIINWPNYGQSAVGDKDAGLLSGTSNQTPQPTASVAKVITALAVLRQKPLKLSETGPVITLSATDVDLYNKYVSKDGSVVKVELGEKITEYQALQALLLPSANNIADSISIWAFGGSREYLAYANSLAVSLGMKQTTITDASGYSPETKSTANDLVILAKAALQEPVLAEIVGQSSATIPVQGEVKNVNWLLGTDGVNGIKTGNTEEAGGCFMASAVRTLSTGQKKTVIAVILGAPNRNTAIIDSKSLLSAVTDNYVPIKVVKSGQTVGYYSVPWKGTVKAIVKENLVVSNWRGTQFKPNVNLKDVLVPSKAGTVVGTVSVKDQDQSSNVVLEDSVNTPPASWRFQRAYQL